MGGAGEANGGPAGVPEAARDESFKRPGAVPFLWEARPGVPKQLDYPKAARDESFKEAGAVPFLWEAHPGVSNHQLDYHHAHDDTTAPQRHQYHPLSPPQYPKKLTPPPPLLRSASRVPGPRRREMFALSFPNSLSFSKPSRSNSNSPSRFAAGSPWRFWERAGKPARHSVSSPSGSCTLSSEAALSPDTPSPGRSTGSSETASSVSD